VEEAPHRAIARLAAERSTRSDRELLAELRALAPLPDEADPAWEDPATWDRANLYHALAGVARERRLRPAAALLLERASHGDPGEMMRGLRHHLEGIFRPDARALSRLCRRLARAERPGTRMWAVAELGVLRAPATLGVLLAGLRDPEALVRREACMATPMLCAAHPRLTARAAAAAREAADAFPRDRMLAGLAGSLEAAAPPRAPSPGRR
jgi:hypothetical protein